MKSAGARSNAPPRAARSANLRYVSCTEPGIERVSRGKGFIYRLPSGGVLRDARHLERIRTLAIPPAWKNVWICVDPNGHLQATGYDARGRKQYRYHARWRCVRDAEKFYELAGFAHALPRLRRRLKQDLRAPKLSKDKVLATVVSVMARTAIRVGNDRYAEVNDSYGLTTLLDRHARIRHGFVEFCFLGKGGKPYRASVRDRQLAAIVKRCRDIPGQRLFQYMDADGDYQPITSSDVNDYLKRVTGAELTAKSFRTWAATLIAVRELRCRPLGSSQAAIRREINQVLGVVASMLGNTPAICRKSYVDPRVLDTYTAGAMARCLASSRRRTGLTADECAVIAILERASRLRAAA